MERNNTSHLTETDRALIHLLKKLGMDLEVTQDVIRILHKSQTTVKEMLVWAYDNNPTRAELQNKLFEFGNAIQRGEYPT